METWDASLTLDPRPTDLIVVLENCKFSVHKDVLMQKCDYFKAMFSSQMSEIRLNEINIKIVEKDPFQVLVEGFYTSQLKLTKENIFSVSAAVHILQVTSPLFTQCFDFLNRMIDHEDCFEVMKFVTIYPIQDIFDKARRYCLQHFLSLREEQSFQSLSWSDLKDYLCDDYLVANETRELFVALKNWIVYNKTVDFEDLKKLVCTCLRRPEQDVDESECESIATAIVYGDDFKEEKWSYLGTRWQEKDVFLFWSSLSESKGIGLVDLIKLADFQEKTPLQGTYFDSMRCIVENPGFDLGAAVCVQGPYVYLCGGSPTFGRVDWIRDIWVFDAFKDKDRWRTIGKLPETRRFHAMVAVGNMLYVFGGFGKYRSKNSYMEGFDINKGSWQALSPMPKHEFKPHATSHHQAIYYITKEWKVYMYSVDSDQWSECEKLHSLESLAKPLRGKDINLPLALHVTSTKSNSLLNFTVILTSGRSVNIMSYPLSGVSKTYNFKQMDGVKYFNSFSMNGKVYIFLTLLSGDDDGFYVRSKEAKHNDILVMSYEPESGKLKEFNTVANVNKCTSIIPIPFIPKTFKNYAV